MMNLSDAFTPKSIVDGQKSLLIPIYQRLFVWEEEQIDKLLNDLWEASESNNDYHLGVVTIHENDEQQWEIVDGQQRLTFLTLLGCMFTKKGFEADCWKKFVRIGEDKYRLFFHGRHEDRDGIRRFTSSLVRPI